MSQNSISITQADSVRNPTKTSLEQPQRSPRSRFTAFVKAEGSAQTTSISIAKTDTLHRTRYTSIEEAERSVPNASKRFRRPLGFENYASKRTIATWTRNLCTFQYGPVTFSCTRYTDFRAVMYNVFRSPSPNAQLDGCSGTTMVPHNVPSAE